MTLKSIEWMERSSILRIVDDRVFPEVIKFIELKDEVEIAQAVRSKAIHPRFVSVAVGYAIAVVTLRHVYEDKHVFMKRIYQTSEIFMHGQAMDVDIHITIRRMLGLAFIAETPEEMRRFSMDEAKLIESEHDLYL